MTTTERLNAALFHLSTFVAPGADDPQSVAYVTAQLTTAITELDDTTCTRCRRDTAYVRDVYYPLSDEYIHLCTDCEPEDTAVSCFELWHTSR